MGRLFCFILFCNVLSAQNIAIGDWASHLNYSHINTAIEEGETIYVGTQSGLFTYNLTDNSIRRFSKLEGLRSLNITALAYANSLDQLVIGYNDGNVDILKNNHIVNIPYVEMANILGSKRINNIFIDDSLAYLSCGFGLVVVDINLFEVKETYYFPVGGINSEVYQVYIFDEDIHAPADNFLADKIFVGTNNGLFYANKHDNLIDYSVWNNDSRVALGDNNNNLVIDLGNTPVIKVVGYDKKETGAKQLIIGTQIDYSKMAVPWFGSTEYNLFQFNTGSYTESFSTKLNLFTVSTDVPGSIISFDYNVLNNKGCVVTNDNFTEKIILLEECETCVDEVFLINTLSVNISDINNLDFNLSAVFGLIAKDHNISEGIFIGSRKNGLILARKNDYSLTLEENIKPNGPVGINVGSIAAHKENIIYTHGGKTNSWNNNYNHQEISLFNNSVWLSSLGLIDAQVYDAIVCRGKPGTENNFFIGTWNNGLLEFNGDSLVAHYNTENSALSAIGSSDGWIRVGGIDFDQNNDLWVVNSQTDMPLVKLSNNNWTQFNVPNLPTNTMAGKLMCASNNQMWVQLRNEGLIVVEESEGELISERIGTSRGLPSQTVNCFTEDHSGAIWVGTSQGLSVFYFPENIFTNSSYSGEPILIETADGYVEQLFANTEILDIKVDGGNRKWVGTKSNGVFLISDDGSSEVYHFTAQNSPLLSNSVYEIAILENSGEVFFLTSSGLCSYRGNSTKSNDMFNNVVVFPNPVRQGYLGDIAISGLKDNTNVKITDIAGNLVAETYSVGGTAIWDGKSFKGERVATGVYLFLCIDSEFEESVVKKILIYN